MHISLQPIGARYHPDASEFVVWAPARNTVELILESSPAGTSLPENKEIAMIKDNTGYWKVTLPLPPGVRYRFRLDGRITCPDPASLSQPEGVHGPSELIDTDRFLPDKGPWKGMLLSNSIIYELHAGCFSASSGFDGIIAKLDYLSDLGINTIELMPLAQFPGDRNWGYDGVYPFAVQNSYGGVPGFQRLVNAAHSRNIAVLVDVVYNHIGPEGNYLEQYGPYFTGKYLTPWGKALNFDDAWSDGVRNFFIQNARMWLEEYHADGLRLDAVHAIRDFSAVHFLQQLKEEVLEIENRSGCKKWLIAETDLNDPRTINPPEKGGYGMDAQWIDEFHHALHGLLTGEQNGYYEDFGGMSHLEKAFAQTYVYNGTYSAHRRRTFGGKADNNPYDQFVVFAQNHDQVGNRATGDRLAATLSFEQLKLAAATMLLSPYIPLLFMGEEYGERNPFQFFTSFSDPALIAGVRKGRMEEFQAFAGEQELPDPQSPETFDRSHLSWDYQSATGAALFSYYKYLIGLRKTRAALQGKTRDTMIVRPAAGKVLSFERNSTWASEQGSELLSPISSKSGNQHAEHTDRLFVWLNFGDQPAFVENDRGGELIKIFDSTASEWQESRQPGSSPGYSLSVADGDIFRLPSFSVLVFEPKA